MQAVDGVGDTQGEWKIRQGRQHWPRHNSDGSRRTSDNAVLRAAELAAEYGRGRHHAHLRFIGRQQAQLWNGNCADAVLTHQVTALHNQHPTHPVSGIHGVIRQNSRLHEKWLAEAELGIGVHANFCNLRSTQAPGYGIWGKHVSTVGWVRFRVEAQGTGHRIRRCWIWDDIGIGGFPVRSGSSEDLFIQTRSDHECQPIAGRRCDRVEEVEVVIGLILSVGCSN